MAWGLGSAAGPHQWGFGCDCRQLLSRPEARQCIRPHHLGVCGAAVEGVALNHLHRRQQVSHCTHLCTHTTVEHVKRVCQRILGRRVHSQALGAVWQVGCSVCSSIHEHQAGMQGDMHCLPPIAALQHDMPLTAAASVSVYERHKPVSL